MHVGDASPTGVDGCDGVHIGVVLALALHGGAQMPDALVQLLPALAQLMDQVRLAAEARAEDGRLPQNFHLWRAVLVPQARYLVLQLFEQVIHPDAPLPLHVVEQVAPIGRVQLVRRVDRRCPAPVVQHLRRRHTAALATLARRSLALSAVADGAHRVQVLLLVTPHRHRGRRHHPTDGLLRVLGRLLEMMVVCSGVVPVLEEPEECEATIVDELGDADVAVIAPSVPVVGMVMTAGPTSFCSIVRCCCCCCCRWGLRLRAAEEASTVVRRGRRPRSGCIQSQPQFATEHTFSSSSSSSLLSSSAADGQDFFRPSSSARVPATYSRPSSSFSSSSCFTTSSSSSSGDDRNCIMPLLPLLLPPLTVRALPLAGTAANVLEEEDVAKGEERLPHIAVSPLRFSMSRRSRSSCNSGLSDESGRRSSVW
uniref:Uncharacterized protein n=1 Tax=Anopheles atroparvus TaxID=41427 RepID=A0A182JIY6_ANOAO